MEQNYDDLEQTDNVEAPPTEPETVENRISREPKMLFFSRDPLDTVVAARPETGSAVIFDPQKNTWSRSDKDYYQIVSDTNYDQISEEQAKSIYGENRPQFGLLNLIDILKLKRIEEAKAKEANGG